MENSKKLIRVRVLVPLLLISTLCVNAQNIAKYYTSTLQSDGTLYFILPQKGFITEYNNLLLYDITYLTTNDSATFNFSYYDKSNCVIDSIMLLGANCQLISSASKIFIESNKRKWHYRYTAKFSFADLNTFYSESKNPKIIIYSEQNIIKFTIKASRWKKQSFVTNKVFTLIRLNK